MSSHGDMFYSQGSSHSDLDRAILRNRILGHYTPSETSESMFGTEHFSTSSFQAMDLTTYLDSTDPMSTFTGHEVFHYANDSFQFNSAESMFEENYLNHLETASTNTSYAPSQYDGECSVQSPTSPAYSGIMSIGSGPQSAIMSPEIANLDSAASPADSFDDSNDDNKLLETLLANLEIPEDGKYRCADVGDEDHSCDYVADRKCMLRKHLEATLKTNACRHPECNGQRFSSKAVLTRHEKEAHGMHAAHQFFCPVPSCERASRGFPREYNMGDHIQRVHRELDVNQYLKKNKRTRKQSTGNASLNTTPTKATMSSGIRKASTQRNRREKLEKQYRTSRESIGKLAFKLPEQCTNNPLKYIEQMKAELARLEEAATALSSQNAASND